MMISTHDPGAPVRATWVAARVGADIILVTLLIAVGRMREDRRVAIGLGRGDAELKSTFAKRFITGSRSFPGWCRQFSFFFVTGECRKARRGEQRRAADHTQEFTSLFVGFGNTANVFHTPAVATIAWLLFWASLAFEVPRLTRKFRASVAPPFVE